MIQFNNIDTSYTIKEKKMLKDWIKYALKKEAFTCSFININICSDKYLLDLNISALQHDYYTDIITFELNDKGEPIEGDLYISIDRIKENAKTEKVTVDKELRRVIIHGVLHLCGYKDKTKQESLTIRGKENYYLKEIESFT
ncbi:MAG: rRNA maturation RNase YbeY [Bacteroidota bacterium]